MAEAVQERILNGALEALATFGARRFSVSAVSERAGVSRGTLYRYFPTKEDLLSALTAHIGRGFRHYLHDRVDLEDDLDDRTLRVADAMREYVDHTPVLTRLLDAEPTFVRNFYNDQFNDLVRQVAAALSPEFASGKKEAQKPDVLAAAELMVRVAMSYRLVEPGSGPLTERQFTTEFSGLLRGAENQATGGAGRPIRKS